MPRIATDIDDLNVSPAPPYNDESPISPASSSRSSFEKSRKPLTEFEHDPMKLEDTEADAGFERKPMRPRRQSWWRHMALKATGTRYTDDLNGEPSPGVLSDIYPMEPRRRVKRNWFNYLVFGGISGCTILMFLLIINLALGVATLFWSEDIDRILLEWGRPGSGTEDLAWYPTDFTRDIVPIPCHSHNDYWRRVPLFSALRAGCTGVEADVWLFDEDLYVGHNTASLTRNRTFQSLYVHPLVELLTKQNPSTDYYNGTNHGVFDTDPGKSLTLLVDVKTSGAETWPWVLAQLEPLRERGWLTYVEDGNVHTRPVTVVGTGNTPFDLLTANNSYRDAFFDAPLNDMWEAKETPSDWPAFDDSAPGESFVEDEGSWEETARSPSTTSSTLPTTKLKDVGQGHSGISDDTSFNSTNSYYASVSFNKAVGHIWRGRLSPRQMKIIRGQIRGAHRRGLKARYWDLPSWPLGLRNHVWDVLVREGVDMLNVDDLRAASRQVW